MARKKKTSTSWEPPAPVSNFDDLFKAMTDEAKEHYPGMIYSGDEDASRLLCLPVPALSVRFLLQQEGWPLERFAQVVGPRASFKSSLGYEVMRWHRRSQGNGVLIETEPKPSPELRAAILEYDKNACVRQRAKTLEEWFGVLRHWVKQVQEAMDGVKDKEGTGRIFPVCFMVDSLTAVLDQKLYSDYESGEDPSKHYSTQASYLSDFLKYMPQQLVDYPFSWVAINHVKERTSTDGRGRPERSVPGGQAPLYHETIEIEMRRRGKVKRANEDGVSLHIETIKNSLAPEQWIEVDFVSWIDLDDRDPRTGHCRQKSIFDWHRASIDVLDQYIKNAGARIKRELQDLLGLHVSDGRVACDVLGISEKKRVDMRTAGEMLEAKLVAEPAFADALYPLLKIRRRQMFKAGVDYRQQIADAVTAYRSLDKDSPAEERAVPEPSGPAIVPPGPPILHSEEHDGGSAGFPV